MNTNNLRKFSELIKESENKHADLMRLVNKMGYSSIDEIKKEKNILSKLESLMKELSNLEDVSEDDADEIENKIKTKGEPKSLEDLEGELEPESSSEKDGEVAETKEKEIEDDINKKGEPTEISDTKTDHIESNDDVYPIPGASDDTDAGVVIPKKRILSFDEFVTGNRNPEGFPPPEGRSDDLEEEEEEVEITEKRMPIKNVSDLAKVYKKNPDALFFAKGQHYAYTGDDMFFTTSDGEEVELSIKDIEFADLHESINESEIDNETDFEEYAMSILKAAHGEDFDEEIATKVVTDLKSKYGEDWGAMVGALKSGMGQ